MSFSPSPSLSRPVLIITDETTKEREFIHELPTRWENTWTKGDDIMANHSAYTENAVVDLKTREKLEYRQLTKTQTQGRHGLTPWKMI